MTSIQCTNKVVLIHIFSYNWVGVEKQCETSWRGEEFGNLSFTGCKSNTLINRQKDEGHIIQYSSHVSVKLSIISKNWRFLKTEEERNVISCDIKDLS